MAYGPHSSREIDQIKHMLFSLNNFKTPQGFNTEVQAEFLKKLIFKLY